MNVLDGKINIHHNVLEIENVSIYLDESAMSRLEWMVISATESVYSYKTDEWEIFFGPYIAGKETGYVFQVINLYSRGVVTTSVPFSDSVGVVEIKKGLRDLLKG